MSEADVSRARVDARVEVLMGPAGSCHQRNTILNAVADCDIVLFLDDDFLMAPDYIEATLAAFATDPNVLVTTGRVLADEATGPGIGHVEGRAILARHAATGIRSAGSGLDAVPTFNGYGCNMAVRLGATREQGICFDERPPLYA